MSQIQDATPLLFADAQGEAIFGEASPQPTILWEDQKLKVIVAGLKAGQRIPVHPEALSVYIFLSGTGAMTADDATLLVQPGSVVILPQGTRRGLLAETELVFLANRVA